MTVDEVREWLESYFYYGKKILALESEMSELRLRAMGSGINYTGTQSSSKANNTEKVLIDIADEETRIEMEINAVHTKRAEIRAVIDSLHNPDLEAVLITRYISGYTLEQTAQQLQYSVESVKKKTNKALMLLAKLYTKIPDNTL